MKIMAPTLTGIPELKCDTRTSQLLFASLCHQTVFANLYVSYIRPKLPSHTHYYSIINV